jgi:hypothetical protein
MVVALMLGQICAAVLRNHDADRLLALQQRLPGLVINLVPRACAYCGSSDVVSSNLAAFGEPWVLKEFPLQDRQLGDVSSG